MKTSLPFVALLLTITPQRSACAAEGRDGAYYLEAMKQSIVEVMSENQSLINRKADGSIKSETLNPDAFYTAAYGTFKTVIGADFSAKKLVGDHDPASISRVLAALLQGGRDEIAKLQVAINTEQDGTVKPKKFIPAVFGRLTAERFKQKTGVEIKQTTLGKNGYKARNAYNLPDDWETAALQKVTAPDWPLNKGFGEDTGGDYRFIKPVYIKQACLTCHGDQVGEAAPYGHQKEGYQVGEIRGGISVKLKLADL